MLVGRIASRQVVFHACDIAIARGVRAGMTLAEATALCRGLVHGDHDPQRNARSLQAFAQWMIRFSPVVEASLPDSIYLDVTGTERLYGGLERLCRLVSESLKKLRFSTRIAIAPTPGAAWAVASFGRRDRAIIAESGVSEALAGLSVAALRLEPEILESLDALGIETIGQLMILPRKSLPKRFGAPLLKRLDQALGLIAEPLVPVRFRRRIEAALEFESPVESLEMLWEALNRLIAEVTDALKTQGRGAKRLVLEFTSSDASRTQKEIHLSQASADSAKLFNLIRLASEAVKTETGFVAIAIKVQASEKLTHEQMSLLHKVSREAERDFVDLTERLALRLGENAVRVAELVPHHVPERAFRLLKFDSPSSMALKSELPSPCHKARPLRLLPTPTEVRCMIYPLSDEEGIPVSFMLKGQSFQLAHARGPERITGPWCEGRDKTREYFDVEDKAGKRFWLFRISETRKWYLHGYF